MASVPCVNTFPGSRHAISQAMSQYTRLEQLFTLAGFENLGSFALAAQIRENTAQKHKDRDSIPYERALEYLAAARKRGVHATVEWLLHGEGEPPRVEAMNPQGSSANTTAPLKSVTRASQIVRRVEPLPVTQGADVPVRDAQELTTGAGSFMLMQRALYVYASAEVGNRAFSFFVHTEDGGWYERGDRVLVDPDLPLMPGKDVVLLTAPDDEGRQEGIFRRLAGIEADKWKTRRFIRQDGGVMLGKVAAESRADWPFCYRIVGSRNG